MKNKTKYKIPREMNPFIKVIESVRFYCEVYNFIILDTILKSRQLSNGDFIATFSEKKIVVLASPLAF